MKNNILTIELLSTKTKNSDIIGQELYDRKLNDRFIESSWWYLHGKLESDCGYDKAVIINYTEVPTKTTIDFEEIDGNRVIKVRTVEPVQMNHMDGIYPVKVRDIDYPCTGYFWVSNKRTVIDDTGNIYWIWEQRGLVVADDDELSNIYALKQYKQKSNFL